MVNISELTAAPSPDLLTPDNCAVLFIDHQPQMFFGTGSGDRTATINSTVVWRSPRRCSTCRSC